MRTGWAAVWGGPYSASESREGSEETSPLEQSGTVQLPGAPPPRWGGHPVEDERAGAEDARVALSQNQGSLPLRLRSPLMGAVGKAEVSHCTCCDCRRQSRCRAASLSDNVPPCPSL